MGRFGFGSSTVVAPGSVARPCSARGEQLKCTDDGEGKFGPMILRCCRTPKGVSGPGVERRVEVETGSTTNSLPPRRA